MWPVMAFWDSLTLLNSERSMICTFNHVPESFSLTCDNSNERYVSLGYNMNGIWIRIDVEKL